jgi:hypothetical protein
MPVIMKRRGQMPKVGVHYTKIYCTREIVDCQGYLHKILWKKRAFSTTTGNPLTILVPCGKIHSVEAGSS